MSAAPVISEQTASFLESGLAIMVGVRDAGLQPDGAWAWAARVHEDREHLTLFLYADAARRLMPYLEQCPALAAVFDQPTTHQACQVKGTWLSARRAKASERGFVERQIEGFAVDLEALGVPRAMTAGWKTWPCTALEMRVEQLFEQTPGPGAGEPLK